MKVIFVTRGWPTEADPMSGNYEAVQAKALAQHGVDVTVVFLQRKSLGHIFDSRSIRRRDENGIMVLSTMAVMTELPGVGRTKYNPLDLWLCQKAFGRIYEYYRRVKGDADLIHAHLIVNAYVCHGVLNSYHIPFVITEHWSKMNYPTLNAGLRRLAMAYTWADKVICVSKALAASLKENLGVESLVIHNMVSDRFFEQRTEGTNMLEKHDCIRFISVGSLFGRKGFDIIISALCKAKNRNKCELSIIGSGPEEANLHGLIEANGLQDKVHLLGQKTPDEVSAQIEASDCFILASRRETFGIVYIEAMAKGKPVIATICGGPESFVNETNGILIPTDDVEAAARAIDYMVGNFDKYDGTAIRKYCHDNFSEEAIVKKIIGVYDEILEQRKDK